MDIRYSGLLGIAACAALLLAGCGKDPRPRTVSEFMEDPNIIDAKLLQCRADRRLALDDIECTNARTAANRLAIAEERAQLEEITREAAAELAAIRAHRARLDAAEQQRRAALIASAEQKVAAGLPLSDAEARALGLNPESSILAEGNTPGASASDDDK